MWNKIIITADDYGMCDSVNRAIDTCINNKVVLSTNVMTNMEYANEASELKRRYPFVSIGLHYNFTVGTPISPVEKVRHLVDKDGVFLSYHQIREKCKNSTYNLSEIALEMQAQYLRFLEICRAPDYWNTHENVHVYPQLYQLFRDTSLNFGIKKMRSHQRIFIPSSQRKSDKPINWFLTEPIKELMLNTWQLQSARLGVLAPDGILVRMNENDKLDLQYLFNNIKWGRKKIAEIAIHPAIDGDNKLFGAITDLRVKEFELFSSTEVIKTAEQANIQIVGFDVVGQE